MAEKTNDVVINVALDTSQASYEIDQLTTKMPKSLEKLVRKFQRVEQAVGRAFDLEAGQGASMIKRMKHVFKEVGKEYATMSKKMGKETDRIADGFDRLFRII